MPPTGAQLCTTLASAGGLACAWVLLRRQRQTRGNGSSSDASSGGMMGSGGGDEHEEEGDVPEEFVCPISFACMRDPVLLCGTGQIYCLTSLRRWLETGSRTCPKTNMGMRDIEVVRLPSLRTRITAWAAEHGQPPPPPLDAPTEVLREAGSEVERLLGELRCGDTYKRGVAAGQFNDLLIQWGRDEPTPARRAAMEAALLDLVWLLRQGDSYGSGVAAAALAQYDTREQVAFLAAVAAMPAVSLLWSPHQYGQHSAARLLAALARAAPAMAEALVEAGAVRGLLQQLDLRRDFPYPRCHAAATLATLCCREAGRDEVRIGGGIPLLKAVALQQDADAAEGADDQLLVRYDKRDAASALLALRLSREEATAPPAVHTALLLKLACCSRAWLLGRAAAPDEGYDPGEEEALRPPLLEASDDDEDGDIVARLNLRAQFLGRALAGQAAPGAQPRLLLAGLAAAQGALARPDQLRLWPLPAPADDDLGPPPGLLGEDEEEEEEDVGPPALADQDFDEEGDSGDEEGGVLEGGAGGGGGGGARPAPAQQDEPPPVDHRGLEDTNSESEGSDDEAPLLMVEDSSDDDDDGDPPPLVLDPLADGEDSDDDEEGPPDLQPDEEEAARAA